MVVSGLYQLLIRLRRRTVVDVGALGSIAFAPGWYVYTGSARNGLHQRVRRHLRHDKRTHWHIDYLLAAADGVEAFASTDGDLSECELHQRTRESTAAVPRFGTSDCRCGSHLAYFRRRPTLRLERLRLGPPT